MALLVGLHGCLGALGDPGARPWVATALLVAMALAHLTAARCLEGCDHIALVLGVALLLRLLLLPLAPTFSDDVLRYVWDGRVLGAGFDPYRHAPEDLALAELRDARWQAMPHKEVPTVYPPLALGVFALAAWLPAPLVALKTILMAAELFGCWLLIRLARRAGLVAGRTIWYAWHPLATFEIAGQGHVDGLMVAATILAVAALRGHGGDGTARLGRPAASAALAGVAAAAAILAKLVPVVALPGWLVGLARSAHRRALLFAITVLLALGLGFLPMFARGVPPGLVAYGVRWEFNGPLYEPLWRGLESIDAPSAIKSSLDGAKRRWADDRPQQHEIWNRLYPYVYPQFLAKLMLAAGFGLAMLRLLWRTASGQDEPIVATGRTFATLLLALATVYPWYVLWVLPWAALARHRAWLAVAATSLLAYLPQHVASLDLFPWFWLLIWSPLVLFAPWSRWHVPTRPTPSSDPSTSPSG
ncbi:MAG: hypothetical protein AAGN46_02450 [Acidobacteriota bacterium]